MKNELNKINTLIKSKMEDNAQKLKKEYEKRYKEKENNIENKFNEMSQIIMKSALEKKDEGKINMSFCTTVHKGYKCEHCLKNPIVGYRYKCSICPNYNLCEKCEENNSKNGKHPHDFVKLRKSQINKDNEINNNNINNMKNNNNFNIIKDDEEDYQLMGDDKKKEYSFQIEQNILLSAYIYEGTDNAKIQLVLRNNGEKAWPRETKLIYDNESVITGNEIILKPQKPGDIESYEIILKNIGQFFAGEYNSYLLFNANGQNYGDKISLKVVIKKKENQKKKEIDEHLEKVKDFRNNFGLDENEYPDEKLLEILKKYNFNFEKAFESLFQ